MNIQKDIILFLNQEMYEKIKKCVKQAYPNEACGLIFGEIKEISNPKLKDDFFYHYFAKKFKRIESTHKSSVAFLMDDEETLIKAADDVKQKYNLELISIFHSHPSGAYPSGVDDNFMTKLHKSNIKRFKHIIWTIIDAKNYDLNGFLYLFNELTQIIVEIKND